ncbi:MAG: Gfo/Idh/MocA family oxidoreductase [bacterium]
MKKVRVAIVGTGFIGDYHAQAIRNVGGAEIVAACGRTRESSRDFAQRYGAPHWTIKAHSLARRDDVDAVIIGIPNKYHAPYSIAMMEGGKDVLIEKPLAMTVTEGNKIISAAKKHKRVAMTGHMWRFDNEVCYIRNVIKSGRLGEVVKTKGYGIHVNWGPPGWFVDRKLAGGGSLPDMGVHAIDTARYIMGDPKPKRVYAMTGAFYGSYNVDDTAVLMITWQNGATSMVESGWWQPHADGPEAATRLFCTKGYASLFPTELNLSVEGHAGKFVPPMPEREEHCDQGMYDRQMLHFLDCVRKRKTPSPGLEEGQAVMKIVEAAYKSSRNGQAVKL